MYTVIIRKREECWRATHQEGLVELKQAGELFEQLVNTVQPLQEDGTLLAHIVSILLVATAVPKLMTVVQPVNLYKHLETLWTTWYSVLELIILQCNKKCAHNTALHRYCIVYSRHSTALPKSGAYITHNATDFGQTWALYAKSG